MTIPLQPKSFSAVPRKTLMIMAIASAALQAAIWTAIAIETRVWLPMLMIGMAMVVASVSGGLQRVVADPSGIVIHKWFFVRVRVAWDDVASVEYPRARPLWNLPLLRLRDGRVVGLPPLRFSGSSRATAARVRYAIDEIALAQKRAMGRAD